MKFTTIFLLVAALAGCALSPADLREQGKRMEYSLRRPPAAAAACVARNAENTGGPFMGHINTSVREATIPGHVELVMFSAEHYFVTADFAPAGSGSVATAWVSPHLMDFAVDRFLGAFSGC